jgi:DUF4097 and DUF4098 domain-containing protein YvlB
MIRKSIFLSLCITVFVTFFIVNLVRADTETFDETYEVSSGTRFEIRNLNGSVNIQGWDRSQIRVHATKKTHLGGKLENVKIHVSQGADFKIETIHLVKNPRVSVSYDLRVPMNVVVKLVRTSNGKIELEATHGDTEVETSNGKIEVKDAVGDIDAHTSNGAIEIKDVMGFVSAHTSNGAINVDGAAGVVELETSNGAIETEVLAIGENGLRVHTSSGAIELSLASDLNVDLEARTSNGIIKLDDLEVVVKEISKNTLRGKIGKGGKKILCRTSNGRIVLKKLK